MYICNTCNMNLCPSCKSQHDNNHKIIDYYDKYYICSKHNEKFNYFCETCKKHACENVKMFKKIVVLTKYIKMIQVLLN